MSPRRADSPGFALVLTLALLAMLVLAIYALSALVRVNSRDEAAARAQRQARQHAEVALAISWRELQRWAGPDARVTAMAGVTGVSAGVANTTRHWCGVWDDAGLFLGWLTSGATGSGPAGLVPGVASITLVGNESVGASGVNSEHVSGGLLPVYWPEGPGAPSGPVLVGYFAYVVLDEGVKISAFAAAAERIDASLAPVLTSTAPTSPQGKLRAALDGYASRLPSVLNYEQLRSLPAPASPLTPSVGQDNFHHVTLTARVVAGSRIYAGPVNLNTTSTIVWRSLLETYNAVPGVTPIPTGILNVRGTAIASGMASASVGKPANAPFVSVGHFVTSDLLAANLPAPITPGEFGSALGPLLTVRSDTFRIRVCGLAVNASDPDKVEARAWAEALVQRTLEPAPGGQGKKFVLRSFRWMTPEEI